MLSELNLPGLEAYRDKRDGVIEIHDPFGFIQVKPENIAKLVEFLSQHLPSPTQCHICGQPAWTILCESCTQKEIEKGEAKFKWEIHLNGKKKYPGKTSKAKAYEIFAKRAETLGFRQSDWDYAQGCYRNELAQTLQLIFLP